MAGWRVATVHGHGFRNNQYSGELASGWCFEWDSSVETISSSGLYTAPSSVPTGPVRVTTQTLRLRHHRLVRTFPSRSGLAALAWWPVLASLPKRYSVLYKYNGEVYELVDEIVPIDKFPPAAPATYPTVVRSGHCGRDPH